MVSKIRAFLKAQDRLIIKKTRPLAKELEIQEFRYRYLLFLTLYLGCALIPSLTWISIGRSYNLMSVEIFAVAILVGASIYSLPKLFALYEGRLINLYPQIKKLRKKQRTRLRSSMAFNLFAPLLHLVVLFFLFTQKNVRKENPFFLTHPLKTNLVLWFFVLLLPTFSIVFPTLGILSPKIPSIPNSFSYWLSPPTVSFISRIHRDVGQTLVWVKQSKDRIETERLDHSDSNQIFAQKLKSKEIKDSLVSPLMMSFGVIGAHVLANKNNRSLSSDTSKNYTKLYIYENYIEVYKNWNPALLYGVNPLSFLNPGSVYEFLVIFTVSKTTNKYWKKKFYTRIEGGLKKLNQEASKDPSAFATRSKIKKLKRELALAE